jgi:two-component system chemotaxis sensor kinase CheA
MDVVRTTLRDHDGDVTVASRVGLGTTFTLTIPIRQAVLVVDGLLVKDSEGRYVVPLEHIREIVELGTEDLKTVHGHRVALVRGEPLAALPLAELLQLPSVEQPGQLWHGIVLTTKEGSLCLLTERILGQRKVVISNLRDLLPGVEKIAGVAQLGGGKLALVLSAPDLVRASSREA